jgi:hypothetical protein
VIRLPRLLVGFAVVLAVVVSTWPQAVRLASVNDFGDPLLNAWALAWVPHAIVSQPAHLFGANIFHPEPHALAYSEALVVPGVVLAPLAWLGVDPIAVHNVLLLLGCVLSGLAVFALVRRLTSNDGAALVAAVIFAIYPYRIEEYPKVQLQLLVGWPIALLAVHRMIERATWRGAAVFAVAIALQAYSCMYYGVMGIAFASVVTGVLILTAPAARREPALRRLAAGAIAAAVLVAPLALEYRAASVVVGERHAEEAINGSAIASDYLRAHPENAAYGDDNHPGQGERRLFPGYTAPLLAVAALAPPIDAAAVAYALGGFAAFDLSLGFNVPGYHWLFDRLAPLRALRVPARFGMFVGLALSVLAGLGVARASRHRSATTQIAIVTIAVALVTLESRMRPQTFVDLPDRAPAVYAWLAAAPRGVVCEYPVGPLEGRAGPQDATYMYYSTRHWQPLVNGYSGFTPPSYGALVDALGGFPDDRAIRYLHDRGVTYLLVHSAFYIRGNFDADVRALEARSDLESVGAFPWRGGGRTVVFRLK